MRWPLLNILRSGLLGFPLFSKVLLPLLVTGSTAATAAEYSSGFRIDSAYAIDDNIQLRETDETSIAGYTVSPGLALTYRTAAFSAGLNGTLNFADFDEEQYNSDDQRAVLTLKETTQHNEFSLDAGINRDSSRTSELLDTGRITNKAVRRKDLWFAPSWTHAVNQQHTLQFSGRVQKVEYQSDNFSDYDYQQVNAIWMFTLSPRSSFHLQAFGNHYENDQTVTVDSDTYGLRVGGSIALSKNLSLSGLAGLMKAKTAYGFVGVLSDTVPNADITESDLINAELTVSGLDTQFEDTTLVLDGNLKYRQQRYSLSLNLSSQTQPSGNGYEQQSDRVVLIYSYRVSQLAGLNLNATYGENQSLDSSINDQRSYTSVQMAINYKITETLSLGGRYRFRAQDRENSTGNADSNAVFITLSYQPKIQKWSR
jgi:hypothetical protein